MISQVNNIVVQLVDIYNEYEWWQKNKMPYEEAVKYHTKMFEQGNIQVYEVLGKILGYVESWAINFEQWGRIVCHAPFCSYSEDVNSGNIAYVANVWVHPNYRNGAVIAYLKKKFFEKNWMCEYFVGDALRKKTQPIKVFSKQDLLRFNKEK